jgi:magnesium transporter
MTKVEGMVFAEQSQAAVGQILSLRLDIINTRKILQNHKNIIKKLIQNDTKLIMDDGAKKLYIGMLDHTKRIWENLENQKDMIEVLNSTNESYLNYKISDIMKTLTIFSVIVFPLTLIAAIFGMNVSMPLVNEPHGFLIIILIMATASFLMLLYFERKKWL